MNGWIKINRSITNHWIYKDSEKLKAWIFVLIYVNHDLKKVNIGDFLFVVKRGESIKSLECWSKLFGKKWDRYKVRRFFKLLENDSMITIKNEHKTTRITVCNYDSYQSECNDDAPIMPLSCNNIMKGWIKIDRNIINDCIFKDSEKLKAWITMLIYVNYEEKEEKINNEIVTIKRGESFNSLFSWSKLFGMKWDKSKTKRFLNVLQNCSKIVQKTTRKTTHLIICDYDSYRDVRPQLAHNLPVSCPHRAHIVPTNKKDKKDKKGKNKEIYKEKILNKFDLDFIDEPFLPLVYDFITYREIELKKGFKTKRGVAFFYNKLKKLSAGDLEKAKSLVAFAENKEWLSVFDSQEWNSEFNRSKDVVIPVQMEKPKHDYSSRFN